MGWGGGGGGWALRVGAYWLLSEVLGWVLMAGVYWLDVYLKCFMGLGSDSRSA